MILYRFANVDNCISEVYQLKFNKVGMILYKFANIDNCVIKVCHTTIQSTRKLSTLEIN